MKTKKRVVKAWARVWKDKGDVYKIIMPWMTLGPEEIEELETPDHYILPCTISYALPTKNKKK